MNVLSLFDGISTGKLALERAGLKVDNYYSSEIDKFCLKISYNNYPEIHQLGAVQNLQTKYLPKIDLLIGGSPCQGFSLAGKGLAFDDPRSALFFEFLRIMDEVRPKFFLLENVRMKKEWVDIITEYMDIEPILINSNTVSPQNRERWYWTNIPNISSPPPLNDQTLGDILEDEVDPKYTPKPETLAKWDGGKHLNPAYSSQANRIYPLDKKAATICAGTHGYNYGYIVQNGTPRKLTPIEFERLQTLPDNYTEGVSNTQRYKACGNGWTVDVLAHIFKNIKLAQNYDAAKNNS